MGELGLVNSFWKDLSTPARTDKVSLGRCRKLWQRHASSNCVWRPLMCPYCYRRFFSTLMRHQVKLDASFLSLVIAVAVVEGLGRSLDSEMDLVVRAMPYVMSPGYRTKL